MERRRPPALSVFQTDSNATAVKQTHYDYGAETQRQRLARERDHASAVAGGIVGDAYTSNVPGGELRMRTAMEERGLESTRVRASASALEEHDCAKSAARARVERALGGSFDYRGIVSRAVDGLERTGTRVETPARADDGWRAYDDESQRTYALEIRGEISRRITAMEEERYACVSRSRSRESPNGEDGVRRASLVRRRGGRVVGVENQGASRTGILKTSVAFGTTVRV
jgi:hypothetical protein